MQKPFREFFYTNSIILYRIQSRKTEKSKVGTYLCKKKGVINIELRKGMRSFFFWRKFTMKVFVCNPITPAPLFE